MVYIGVDLHRKRSQVAAVNEEGEVLFNRNVASNGLELLEVFGELQDLKPQVAFEATYGWGWFADLLADAGIPAHMAHPLATKAIAANRVKNDSVDAKTLAHLLRTGLLPEAWIAPPEVREARCLVRMRAALVRVRTRIKCQLHALLAEHGVHVEATDIFGPGGRRQLAELQLRPMVTRRIEAALRVIDELTLEIDVADTDLQKQFDKDPRVRRLMAIPGIGLTTAATLVAEIWDISRFDSPERLCSWAGLTPREHSSLVIPAAATFRSRGRAGYDGSWSRLLCMASATPGSANGTWPSPHVVARRSRLSPWVVGSLPSRSTPCVIPRAAVLFRLQRPVGRARILSWPQIADGRSFD